MSLTISGVAVSVLGSLLVSFGFSETCSSEIVTLLPVLAGGVMSYIGRVRMGDVTPLGFKK